MSRNGNSIVFVRVLQGILATANLVLAAFAYHRHTNAPRRPTPSALQFLIFAPCVSLISLAYLAFAARQKHNVMAHRLMSMGADGFNSILYLGGFIAFALTLSDDDGSGAQDGLSCTLSRAVAVVAAAEFSAWITSTICAAHEWFQSEAHMIKVTAARRQMAEAGTMT